MIGSRSSFRALFLFMFAAVLSSCQTMQRTGFTDAQVSALTDAGFEAVGDHYELGIENRVLFEFDSDIVSPPTKQMLGELSAKLSEVGIRGAIVEGHTDDVGDAAYNQALSEKRAATVRDGLVAGRLRNFDVSIHGVGEADPIESNSTDEGRQQNRRVVIVVTPQHAMPL